MRVLDCEQGSLEWMAAHLGIPTASQVSNLLTPKTLKPSAAQTRYMGDLLAEWALGQQVVDAGSMWMTRGTAMEEEAARWYAVAYGRRVETVGMWITDDGRFGGSPDRLVDDDGILEIKCPSASVHMSYWIEPAKLVDAYRLQTQAQLWLGRELGREWTDLVSYNPELPKVVQRVTLEPEFVEAFEPVLNSFWLAFDAYKADFIRDHGEPKPRALEYEPAGDGAGPFDLNLPF